jgi:D-sedoheptulose 7-phosphate isomerase
MINILDKIIFEEFNEIRSLLNPEYFTKNKNFNILIQKSLDCIKSGKKILFYGNGGSAADAQHLAAELVVKYRKKRKAIPAIALTTDTSIMTATSNDFNFENIFSRQIEAIGNKGDISISITTSGNSKNLIKAAKICKQKKIKSFCFSGNNGGKLKRYIDYPIIIPSNKTSVIQVIEIAIGQILCNILEDAQI